MPTVFSTKDMTFKRIEPRIAEFIWNTSPQFAKKAESKHLEFDIRSLDPGRFSFPYHFHRAAEELFYIVSGEATLRLPEDFRKIVQGDLIFFEEGPQGAHQLYNHGDVPCVYLDIRTTFGIDVCEYPDSGKINILPFQEIFESGSKVEYYRGEEHVISHWPPEILKHIPQDSPA